MFQLLLLVFIIIPLLEVWIFVTVGREIGAAWVILMIFVTAIVGVYCLRMQGISTYSRAQQRLQVGEVPAAELLEGAMLLFAGALLLTPGFATDATGFSLLIPAVRRFLAKRLQASFLLNGSRQGSSGASTSFKEKELGGSHEARTDSSTNDRETLEGEYRRED